MPDSGPVPIRALVVDDDPIILALLSAFLQARGYAVAQASHGEEALARLGQDASCNLVITDRHMPRMDGMTLCRRIRALERGAYVYCIMLTAGNDQDSLVEAMEAGVDDFLAKPLNPAELGARLHAAERVLALEDRLARRNQRLAEAYAQLSRELEMARALQLSLLPPPTEFGPARLDWVFQASSFVGGDTFDYFAVGPRHLCFHVVDVAGHGVAAAMMAFNAQHQLRALSQQLATAMLAAGGDIGATVVAVVSEYNRRFLQASTESSQYLTMVYGIADVHSGATAFVQAGHPPPLVAGAQSDAFEPVGDGGLPVGILPDFEYESQRLVLAPGSRLVLYSDGVTDCCNAQGEPFGLPRLGQLLRSRRPEPLSATGAALREALRDWRGEAFEDDVTLLALEVG